MRFLCPFAILALLLVGCSQHEPTEPVAKSEPVAVEKPSEPPPKPEPVAAKPPAEPPKPVAEAKPQPKPEPAPAAKPAPKPEPVAAKPEPKPEPKPAAAPAPPAAPAPAPAPGPAPPAKTAAVDMDKLLGEMTDLRRLAKLPKPAYTTKQASSYDRASKAPGDDSWFANGDAGQFMRTEDKDGRKENVMMDADGPGAIVRIWSANPEGTLRIYLDGQAKPVIEAPMKTFLGGTFENNPKPIAGEYSSGWNSYLPIPYAKHCKVTSDAGGFYYHVNYRTYAAGTSVKTFEIADLKTLATKIADVAKKLASPREAAAPPADATKSTFDVSMAEQGEVTLDLIRGHKAVCGFMMHLAANDLAAAARQTMFYITFDTELTVKCPLGDFFCTFPGLNTFDSLPVGVSGANELDLWCHWWMPFDTEASITVRNFSPQRVDLKGEIFSVPNEWNDDSLYFHSSWKIDRDVPARPITDWNHMEAEGNGRFVGGALFITNTSRDWWGEGDEKIYVDGEKFPSFFGTGTEDYYGFAWCNPARFIHAYHNQPNAQGPGNYGNTSVNRFHILDDIPFTKSFKFDIENWHGSDKPEAKTTRAAISFWYARPLAKDHARPLKDSNLEMPVVPPYVVHRVKGAVEGEEMGILDKTGAVEPQDLGTEFSNEKHLWWQQGKPGEKLKLGFDSAFEGKRHVIAKLTKAVDYAKVQLYVNGNKAGDVIDLYHEGVTPGNEMDLGEFDLKKGQNTLTIEIVGANEKAAKAYMVGLDYILLKGPASAPTTQVK